MKDKDFEIQSDNVKIGSDYKTQLASVIFYATRAMNNGNEDAFDKALAPLLKSYILRFDNSVENFIEKAKQQLK